MTEETKEVAVIHIGHGTVEYVQIDGYHLMRMDYGQHFGDERIVWYKVTDMGFEAAPDNIADYLERVYEHLLEAEREPSSHSPRPAPQG